LINVGFDELATAVRSQSSRCFFGFGEADGDNRAHSALERALRSPLMDRGRLLSESSNVLVHVAGGPAMTLNEVQILMEHLNRHISDQTRLLFSVAVDPALGGNLNVLLLGAIGGDSFSGPSQSSRPIREVASAIKEEPGAMLFPAAESAPKVEPAIRTSPEPVISIEPVYTHLERESETSTVSAVAGRFTAPGPDAPARASKVSAKSNAKAKPPKEEKQEQMLFEPVTRGRFEKSEPTIVDGQDLDVPAFMRMHIRLK